MDSVPMKFNSLDEMEKIVIKTFINNQGIFSKCEPEVKESYFEKDFFRRVFVILRNHYRQYASLADLDIVREKLQEQFGSGTNDELKEKLELYLRLADTIFAEKIIDIKPYEDITVDFIYKKKCKDAIQNMTNILTRSTIENPNSELTAIEGFVNEIKNGASFNANKREPYNLADFKGIPEIRKEAIGEDNVPKVARLFIERMNKIMQYDGIPIKSLVLVSAVPGGGKSTFLINQGLYSAKQGLKVCHIFLGDMTRFDGFVRYYSCFYDSTSEERNERKLKLTEKLKAINKMYDELKEKESNGTINDEDKNYLIQLEKSKINAENEMKELEKPLLDSKEIVKLQGSELSKLIEDTSFSCNNCFQNVDIYEYAVGELTIDQLREEVMLFQKLRNVHYDIIIIDYDRNLRQTIDNMYEANGEIYDKAKNLAEINNSVIFIASQPKPSYWSREIIPLEAAAESSRKQQVIDMMITLGRPVGNTTGLRYLSVPKNRRGEENKSFRLKLNGNSGYMYQISDEEYEEEKKKGLSSDYKNSETFIEKQLREKEEKQKQVEEGMKAQEELRKSLNPGELTSVENANDLFKNLGYEM